MNLRDELLAIRDAHGVLTPRAVLEATRDEAHPLHSRVFDKPVPEAAEAYYLGRAHELIRVARVKLPTGNPIEPRDVRAFQAVRGDDFNSYVYEPSEAVASDPLLRAIVLRDMERDWRHLRERYAAFSEFAELVRKTLDEEAA